MKKLYIVLFSLLFLMGCATKSIPAKDISDAKLALAKLDITGIKSYFPKESQKIKRKYALLKELLAQKRYDEAKFLSQEIVADYRVLEMRAKKEALEGKRKKLQEDFEEIESMEDSGEE